MCKSLKATYTFSQKVKLTILTAKKSNRNRVPGRRSNEKNMAVNTSVQSGSCVKYSILGD